MTPIWGYSGNTASLLTNTMTAIDTKRTYRVALHMSAFGGKADVLCLL